MAQFIVECESVAPGSEQVVQNLIETIYEYGSGGKNASGDRPNGPLVLMTAHRAKGLEFDRVIVVEPAAIAAAEPDHRTGLRRLYVVLTRAVSELVVVHAEPLPPELA